MFQVIGKYIHPTRYKQIIETESANKLDLEEQRLVSEDQKHSSNAARVHYQKLRSRNVALKGRTHACMHGKAAGRQGKSYGHLPRETEGARLGRDGNPADNTETKAITTRQHSQQSIGIAMATKGPVSRAVTNKALIGEGVHIDIFAFCPTNFFWNQV